MTKVSVLGQEPKKELKKIEFVKVFSNTGSLHDTNKEQEPKNWNNILLLERNYAQDLDLMFAYDCIEDPSKRCSGLFLGRHNDGVV